MGASELEKLRQECAFLERENQVFQAHLDRLRNIDRDDPDSARSNARNKSNRKFASFSKAKVKAKEMKLSLKDKIKISNTEYEYLQKKQSDEIQDSKDSLVRLQALISVHEIKLQDIKREAYELKRDVVSKDPKKNEIDSEKIRSYMKSSLLRKDKMIEKLSNKTQNLRQRLNKLTVQLKKKEDQGESLHFIDFHQLQIENKQLLEKVEMKNKELLKKKNVSTNLIVEVNQLKEQVQESAKIVEEIEGKIKDLENAKDNHLKVKIDQVKVEIEKEKAQMDVLQKRVKGQKETVPSIQEYIDLKASVTASRKVIKDLMRKIEIAEIKS